MLKLISFCSCRRVVMASSTPLRLCSLRRCAWAAIPAVLRFQVISLMCLLQRVMLTLLPFFVGVFAFLLVGFRDDVSLLEQGDGWADTFIEIFLIDFDP